MGSGIVCSVDGTTAIIHLLDQLQPLFEGLSPDFSEQHHCASGKRKNRDHNNSGEGARRSAFHPEIAVPDRAKNTS